MSFRILNDLSVEASTPMFCFFFANPHTKSDRHDRLVHLSLSGIHALKCGMPASTHDKFPMLDSLILGLWVLKAMPVPRAPPASALLAPMPMPAPGSV